MPLRRQAQRVAQRALGPAHPPVLRRWRQLQAAKRARRLSGLEYQEFRRKLGEFLARRGFNYDTIEPVVERVWRESQAGSAEA